jgi:hypothetical protein
MSDRFVRVYDARRKEFYWTANVDDDVRRADTEKAGEELKRALYGVLSLEQWRNFERRLFPPPREPFRLAVRRPVPLPGLPVDAVSAPEVITRYGRQAFEEMVRKGMVDLVPDYNALVPNVPVRHVDDTAPHGETEKSA